MIGFQIEKHIVASYINDEDVNSESRYPIVHAVVKFEYKNNEPATILSFQVLAQENQEKEVKKAKDELIQLLVPLLRSNKLHIQYKDGEELYKYGKRNKF